MISRQPSAPPFGTAGETLQTGDVVAVSSKYTAISEGRIVKLDDVQVSPQAQAIADRYDMNPRMAQLVVQEADHIFGGIPGFLLTFKDGIISPNAGLDRSNIPNGYVVLFSEYPYRSAANLRHDLRAEFGVDIGVILTDSWLMPGRWGTTGVALATAGFRPIQDERGKIDLFGNPMQVTQRGIADTICAAAELVMGERDEATAVAIVRNAGCRADRRARSPKPTSRSPGRCASTSSRSPKGGSNRSPSAATERMGCRIAQTRCARAGRSALAPLPAARSL